MGEIQKAIYGYSKHAAASVFYIRLNEQYSTRKMQVKNNRTKEQKKKHQQQNKNSDREHRMHDIKILESQRFEFF